MLLLPLLVSIIWIQIGAAFKIFKGLKSSPIPVLASSHSKDVSETIKKPFKFIFIFDLLERNKLAKNGEDIRSLPYDYEEREIDKSQPRKDNMIEKFLIFVLSVVLAKISPLKSGHTMRRPSLRYGMSFDDMVSVSKVIGHFFNELIDVYMCLFIMPVSLRPFFAPVVMLQT